MVAIAFIYWDPLSVQTGPDFQLGFFADPVSIFQFLFFRKNPGAVFRGTRSRVLVPSAMPRAGLQRATAERFRTRPLSREPGTSNAHQWFLRRP
jgi:hypothetical protein